MKYTFKKGMRLKLLIFRPNQNRVAEEVEPFRPALKKA